MKIVGVILVLILVVFSGCAIEEIPENETMFKDYSELWFEIDGNGDFVEVNTTNQTSNNEYVPEYIAKDDLGDNYLIGTYYIDDFDEHKANHVLIPTIVDIIDDYDILLIQGIEDEEVITKLNDIEGYDWKASPKLGKEQEQMMFFYSERVKPGSVELYPFEGFDKTPYAMSFFLNDLQEIVLIGFDIDKYDAEEELNQLKLVYRWARRHYLGRDGNNIYLMGNMWADCVYFDSYNILEMYQVLIDDTVDTTTDFSNCSYDRILTDEVDPKFMGVGVDNLSKEVESIEELKAISSRYPVYFVFEKLSKDD